MKTIIFTKILNEMIMNNIKILLASILTLTFLGCSDDNDDFSKENLVDYYNIISYKSDKYVDLNNDKKTSANLMDEIDILNKEENFLEIRPNINIISFNIPLTLINYDYPSAPDGYANFVKYGFLTSTALSDKVIVIKNNSYMASKDQEEKIILNKGQYFEDVFNNIFIKNYKNKINFIGVIPFARNMLEYLSNEEQSNFLTSCLHIKENTKNILIKDVHNSLLNLLPAKKDIELPFENEKLLDVIFSEADKLAENYVEHSIDLELKLLIAIACRLKAELYMSEFIDVNERIKVKKDQTQEFYKLCITKGVDLNALKVLNRVNLITPEHIHLNSFMFEPLVDMSIKHLIDLYNDIGMLYEINNTGT